LEFTEVLLPAQALSCYAIFYCMNHANKSAIATGLALLLCGFGCTSTKPPASAAPRAQDAGSRIIELNLLTMPVAVNLDGIPGVDGFAIRVYPSDGAHPKAQPIRSGALDILMYDGLVSATDWRSRAPRQTWSFTAAELKQRAFSTAIGTGYKFALSWGNNPPSGNKLTILVRYQSPDGSVVYSEPSSINLSEH